MSASFEPALRLSMNRTFLRNFLIIAAFAAGLVSAKAQAPAPPNANSVTAPLDTAASLRADSLRIVALSDSLEQALLDAANQRLELALLKHQISTADSVERAKQIAEIEKIRATTRGVPVVIDEDSLFSFFTNRGGYSAQQRALITRDMIQDLGSRLVLKPDSVYIDDSDNTSDIMYDNIVITSLTERDALWAGIPQDSLARQFRVIIVDELKKLQNEHGLWQLVKRIGLLLLIIVAQYFLFRLTFWLFRRLRRRIEKMRDSGLKPIMIQNYALLDTAREVRLLLSLSNIVKWVVIGLQLLISIPMIFAIFPQTENLAYTLFGYIWYPIKSIWHGVVEYVPNFFTIAIIWLAIRYLVKLVRYFSKEIESERLKINGFYPDWARPTFNIIRFLLYAFMIAMIYPYLPGADTGVFQGISVFVGLIVSLGSSTVIGNIIAGMVITYMRPFRKGDRIKVDDTVGDIIEKTPLVTRIRTPKNEVVTVPNSFIMSSKSVNYTTSAREFGLILHTEVTIGYDVPWRQVHRLLIEAALATEGILDNPQPFVLETGLNDWYPVYQLNAYTRDAQRMAVIYSQLHQNIQDRFNEEGVEIMSPTYIATRDGNATTVVSDPMHGSSK